MAKLVTTPITSGYAANAALNANFLAVEVAMENTLSRDGTAPNTMNSGIDMNSNRITNLPVPIADNEPITKGIYDAASSPSATQAAISAAAAAASALIATNNASTAVSASNNASAQASAALISANSASSSAAAAVISADASAASAALAASWTSMGFGGTLLDLGLVSDATTYFPTDLGVLV